MKRFLIGLFVSLVCASSIYAVPAYPGLITRTQPDGSLVDFYMVGDEYFHYMMSEDGYLLCNAKDGFVQYARLNVDNTISAVGINASQIAGRTAQEIQYILTCSKVDDIKAQLKDISILRRSEALNKSDLNSKKMVGAANAPVQKSYPLKGSPKSLVILANYTDIKFKSTTAKDDYSRLLNEVGYSDFNGTGSARDYFMECSNNQFSPDFVVVGPVDLPQNARYYGEQFGDNNHDRNPEQMIIDACRAADPLVDFTDFDTDGDGRVDNVFVYYAGHNQAEGGGDWTIWPHRSKVYSSVVLDGVRLNDYACTSEFRGASGSTRCGIGTFCHEFGHVLSLPDFYDTDYAHNQPTLGRWDIMDQGSYNNDGCTPPSYSSYERFSLGWLTPDVLSEETIYSLEPLITSNKAYMVTATKQHNLSATDPNPKEFWMIENRRRKGMDQWGLPAEGLLVTHVVYNRTNWNYNRPNGDADNMGVEIVCAASNTYSPARNTYPGQDRVTKCDFVVRADGSKLETPLSGISETGDITSFYFGFDPYAPRLNFSTKSFDDFVAYFGQTKPTQSVDLVGTNITDRVSVRLLNMSRSHFRFRLITEDGSEDGSEEFDYDSYIAPNAEDSSVNVRIEVMLDPYSILYDTPINDKLLVTAGSIQLEMKIVGYSMPEKVIFTPQAYEAENVAPFSCTASWQNVPQAFGYKLSVYSVVDKPFTQVEQFSTFDKAAPEGWIANFNTVQKTYNASAPVAAYFTKAEDRLESKEYFMPLQKLSFWIHAFNSVGTFKVYALSEDATWKEVHTEQCTATTRSKIVTINFDEEVYRRFAFQYTPESGTGGLAFDDCTAHFSKEISYVHNNRSIGADTTYLISGLQSGKEYRYTVAAVQSDEEHRYEYVSDPSNEIVFSTIEGGSDNPRQLAISRDENGYKVFVPEVLDNYYIFIYNNVGVKVAEVPVTSSEVRIPRLVNGLIYVIKYAEKDHQKRKTQVGKLFYQE